MGDSFHVRAPMQALVVSVPTEAGQAVSAGQTLVILEAMKMEHIVAADQSGVVKRVLVRPDAMVAAGDPLLLLEPAEHVGNAAEPAEEKTEFTVVLASVGAQKIGVIKEVRAITSLGLKEAKELVESAPKAIKEGVAKDEAQKIKEKIEGAGGQVDIK